MHHVLKIVLSASFLVFCATGDARGYLSTTSASLDEKPTSQREKMEVINAGIGGNTSGQLLERIEEDVIGHRPDLVIVMVGTNDMVNSGKLTSYDVYRQNLQAL